MHVKHIYLKIEELRDYSPVAPDAHDHERGPVDCMRTMGHEDATIPPSEVARRTLDALIYREYHDANFTMPKDPPLIAADINEPRASRRIPGTVIYAQPGERLYVHVFNGDDQPHSMHVHGLHYGIDSDGSWPFGVHRDDGSRSDAICPGHQWCYIFDVDENTIGAWPFHDHHMEISAMVNRGLFGGIVVRDPGCEKPDHEVPIFFHRLAAETGRPLFDSGTLRPGDPDFFHQFDAEGTYEYYCKIHPGMRGTVRVTAAGPLTVTVNILDTPPRYELDDVPIRAGGTVTWHHGGTQDHTVSDASSAALESPAINGRTFVGNTPTIVAESSQRIRWYVFNLDLGMLWHNFHVHGHRWRSAGELVDTKTIGPAESFVADTIVSPVILCPPPLECGCEPQEGHDASPDPEQGELKSRPKPSEKKQYCLEGDFLFHCHVEMHMMEGMAGLVRATQEVELTDDELKKLCFHLPKVRVHPHACPEVDHHPCGDKDGWERVADSPIFIVHGAQLANGRVLLFSGAAERGLPMEARTWDPATKTMAASGIAMPDDFFCSGHTFLADGRLLVVGGDTNGAGHTNNRTFFFTLDAVDPATGTFSLAGNMSQARWYPTALRLGDGRVLVFSGDGADDRVEVFDGTWNELVGARRLFDGLYPGLHLLSTGEIFYTRTGWNRQPGNQSAYLTLTGPTTGFWTDYGNQQFFDRQEGMSLVMIDTTVTPVQTKVFVFGGGVSDAATARNPLSAELIEFNGGVAGATWRRLADMNNPRINLSAVVLPDGRILIAGGCSMGNRDPGSVVLPAEIYNPVEDKWTAAAPLSIGRQYHSVFILLPDARVLAAGGEPEQRSMELYTPGYLNRGLRPVIAAAPATVTYGNAFTVATPQAGDIESIVLIAPISVTHHTDAGQRYIKLPITARTASELSSLAPANGNIAPPGFYMLYIVNNAGVPSEAQFLRIA